MKHPGIIFALLLGLCLAPSAAAQLLLVEDFDYPEGDSLKLHDWVMTGSPSGYSYVNPVCVVAPGLTFPGYKGSGVGNAAAMAPTGQDVSRYFSTPAGGGSVYAFLLVNVGAARSSGDYFFHLIGGAVTSSTFAPKLSVKSSEGRLAFGVSKRANANAATYTGFDYGMDTTYLVVLKYRFKPDSTADDEVSLFVFGGSGVPGSEPAVPTVGPVVEATGSDVDSLYLCALRQGGASSAPTLTVDGIRVATSWQSALPILISSFRAAVEEVGTVTITWTTQSEVDNYGFEVQRSEDEAEDFFTVSELIPGHNTTMEPHDYSFTDRDVPPGRWFYRLKSIALDQSVSYSEVIEVANIAEIGEGIMQGPLEFGLEQNYPNPFNPKTHIRYSVPQSVGRDLVSGSGRQGQVLGVDEVKVAVYDLLGREVAMLVDERKGSGTYQVEFDGSALAGGVYVCRLMARNRVASRKMVLVK